MISPPAADEVARVAAREQAELIVVGLPVSLDGVERDQAVAAREFAAALGSRDRGRDLRRAADDADGRVRPRGRQRPADALAAAHLLESYLRVARAGRWDRHPDWHDPFSQDEEAVERERRGAEREQAGANNRDRWARRSGPLPAPRRPGSRRTTPCDGDAEAFHAPRRPRRHRRGRRARRAAAAPSEPADPRRGDLLAIAVLLCFGVSKVIGALDGGPLAGPKPKPVQTKDLTIPEGLDRHQIAELAKKAGIKGDYESDPAIQGLRSAKYGAGNPPNLEGFLFPATYELRSTRPSTT